MNVNRASGSCLNIGGIPIEGAAPVAVRLVCAWVNARQVSTAGNRRGSFFVRFVGHLETCSLEGVSEGAR